MVSFINIFSSNLLIREQLRMILRQSEIKMGKATDQCGDLFLLWFSWPGPLIHEGWILGPGKTEWHDFAVSWVRIELKNKFKPTNGSFWDFNESFLLSIKPKRSLPTTQPVSPHCLAAFVCVLNAFVTRLTEKVLLWQSLILTLHAIIFQTS